MKWMPCGGAKMYFTCRVCRSCGAIHSLIAQEKYISSQEDGRDHGRPVAAEAPPHQLPLAGHVVFFLLGRQLLGTYGSQGAGLT
jgi:hypothetical protein